ncbi:MAG: hypothetical protein ACK4WB_05655, partial [Desulfatiglandales bacterium]
GILAVRDKQEHLLKMKELGIETIDMVVVNLYQFERAVSRPDIKVEDAVENIDIGGPTLLRAAAKNFRYVTVVSDPGDYPKVIEEMRKNNCATTLSTRFYLARKVFQLTSNYDRAIFNYLEGLNLALLEQ